MNNAEILDIKSHRLVKGTSYANAELAAMGYPLRYLTSEIMPTVESMSPPADTYELLEDIYDPEFDAFTISLDYDRRAARTSPLRVLLFKGLYRTGPVRTIYKILVLDAQTETPTVMGYSSLAILGSGTQRMYQGYRSDVLPAYRGQALMQRARSLLLFNGDIKHWRSSEWREPPAVNFYARITRDPRFLVRWLRDEDEGRYVVSVSKATSHVMNAKRLLSRLAIGPKDRVATVGPGHQLPSDEDPEQEHFVPWEWLLACSGAQLDVFEPYEAASRWRTFFEEWFGRGNKRIHVHGGRDGYFEDAPVAKHSLRFIVLGAVLSSSQILETVRQEIFYKSLQSLVPGGFLMIGPYNEPERAELEQQITLDYVASAFRQGYRLTPIGEPISEAPAIDTHHWQLYRVTRIVGTPTSPENLSISYRSLGPSA